MPHPITAEPLPDIHIPFSVTGATPSTPFAANLESPCSIIGDGLPLPAPSRVITRNSPVGTETLATASRAGACVVDAAGVEADLDTPAADHALEEQPKTPAETAGESLKAYYEGYKKEGWKDPHGVKTAFPVLTELLDVGRIDDALQLIDFMGNPEGANSYMHDSYQFGLKMGWDSGWTAKLLETAETHKNTALGDRTTDTLFKLASEYTVLPSPSHTDFLAKNLSSAMARRTRQIDGKYQREIGTATSGRNIRGAQGERDTRFYRAGREYTSMIDTMFRISYGSEQTQLARAVLGLQDSGGNKIAESVLGYFLNRGVGQVLTPLGFDHGALERSWKTGYGNLDRDGNVRPYALTPEQYRLENIKTIGKLENEQPGSAASLHKTLGIHNFARLTDEMIKDAYDLCSGKIDFTKLAGPIALLAQDSQDHNGSAYSERPINDKIRQDVKQHKGLLIPVELSSPESPDRLKQNLIDLKVPKIDLLILDNHGHEKTVSSASSPTGAHTTTDLRDIGGFIRAFMNEKGFILAYFCSGAKNLIDGTGRALADGSGLPVMASPAVTSIEEVNLHIGQNRRLTGITATFKHDGRRIRAVPIMPDKRTRRS